MRPNWDNSGKAALSGQSMFLEVILEIFNIHHGGNMPVDLKYSIFNIIVTGFEFNNVHARIFKRLEALPVDEGEHCLHWSPGFSLKCFHSQVEFSGNCWRNPMLREWDNSPSPVGGTTCQHKHLGLGQLQSLR